jgi:hypothetical protein
LTRYAIENNIVPGGWRRPGHVDLKTEAPRAIAATVAS